MQNNLYTLFILVLLMRLKELQDFLKSKGIDAALIFSKDINFRYLNGFNDFNGVFVAGKGKAFIFTSVLEESIARSKSRIRNVYAAKKDLFKEIKKRIKCRVIGINKNDVALNQYKRLKNKFKRAKFVDISDALDELRARKTESEIRIIKQACRITEGIFKNLAGKLSSKKSENEIAWQIKKEMLDKGCEEAFPTIVATGKNSGNIHHIPTSKKLKGFTVIDFGVRYKDYCTDATRTFYIGNPSKKDIREYTSLFSKFEAVKTADDIKKIKPLKNQHHANGHSIGIEVHENPTLHGSKIKIGNDYVLAVELGSYTKRHGMRIENMLLIKNNKLINLINYPKNLRILRR